MTLIRRAPRQKHAFRPTLENLESRDLQSATPVAFAVTVNGTLTAAQKSGLDRAVENWSRQLTASYANETIHIVATPENFSKDKDTDNDTTIASTRASEYRPWSGALAPAALFNHLRKGDDKPDSAEIAIMLNSSPIMAGEAWDFVLTHEIGHGLGFDSNIDKNGKLPGEGGLGLTFGTERVDHRTPGKGNTLYDNFLYWKSGDQYKKMVDLSVADRATAVVSNAVYWGGSNGKTAGGGYQKMYAPSTWDEGSSISHFLERGLGDDLMSPFSTPINTIISNIDLGVLQDIGWDVVYPFATSKGTPATTDFVASAATGTTVRLAASNGRLLCAAGGGGGTVAADRDVAGPWETFTVVRIGRDQVALRTSSGLYLSADTLTGTVLANQKYRGLDETFQVVEAGGGLAFKTSDDLYLGIDPANGGRLVVRAAVVDATEVFSARYEIVRNTTVENAFVQMGRVAFKSASGSTLTLETGSSARILATASGVVEMAQGYQVIKLSQNVVALRAANGNYLSAAGGQVRATAGSIGVWERFEVFGIASGNVGLRAVDGRYVCAESGGGREVVANRNALGAWETFQFTSPLSSEPSDATTVNQFLSMGSVVIRPANGQFLSVASGNLRADAGNIWTNEVFQVVNLGGGKVALRGGNGRFVTAEAGGSANVTCNRTQIGVWETFTVVGLGSNRIALKSSDGTYLCAEDGGGRKVDSMRYARGPWETFTFALDPRRAAEQNFLSAGSITLRTSAGYYLCAENGGGSALNATRKAAAAWETFTVIPLGGNRFALRTRDGHYLRAVDGGGKGVDAVATAIGAWENFTVVGLDNNRIAFRASNGQFICAEDGGGRELNANRGSAGSWESFTFSRV